jgi:hypothetical protein
MASGPLPQRQRPFSRFCGGSGNDQYIEGDPVMDKKSKPVKGKKTAPVKPLMKRADLPAVKPLIRF